MFVYVRINKNKWTFIINQCIFYTYIYISFKHEYNVNNKSDTIPSDKIYLYIDDNIILNSQIYPKKKQC